MKYVTSHSKKFVLQLRICFNNLLIDHNRTQWIEIICLVRQRPKVIIRKCRVTSPICWLHYVIHGYSIKIRPWCRQRSQLMGSYRAQGLQIFIWIIISFPYSFRNPVRNCTGRNFPCFIHFEWYKQPFSTVPNFRFRCPSNIRLKRSHWT